MKKTTIIMITSLLMTLTASAASLELQQKHVFTSEEFEVEVTQHAPFDGTLELAFNGETKKISIENLEQGYFTQTLTLKAPPYPGTYTIKGDFEKEIGIEENPLQIESLETDPSTIDPRETTKLKYRITNTGKTDVYNVEVKVNAFGGERFLEIAGSESKQEKMAPEESSSKVVNIKAKPSSEGNYNIVLRVSYEFNEETHVISSSTDMNVGGSNNIEIVLIGLIVLLGLGIAIKNYI